ncbi:MAG TPA: ABC transporter permease [Aggregatilineales bacterium]|nr:ABC transporter permease [Aggregatilineales bacterium]
MNLLESVRVAMAGLGANRLRALLTMLGIVIGVGAVIALVSLGQGVERYVKGVFQGLGSNLLVAFTSIPNGSNPVEVKPMTLADAEAVGSPLNAPSVLRSAAEYDILGVIVAGRNSTSLAISGVTASFTDVRGWVPDAGRFIDAGDILTAARVAVLGKTMVKQLFDPDVDPVGQLIRINNIPFHVIGVMSERGGSIFGDNDLVIFAPISTVQTRLSQARTRDGSYLVSLVYAQAISAERMPAAQNEIEKLLADRHGIQFRDEEDFQVITQDQVLSVVGNVTGLLTVFLAVVAGISLLVGGIGIMNIMLVSVTERTREIGLRKAIGARSSDILLQFLIESVVIALIGGVLGIGVGGAAAAIGGKLIPQLTLTVTPRAMLLATGVSTATGVFFGLYPARRAAHLRPIDALRYE